MAADSELTSIELTQPLWAPKSLHMHLWLGLLCVLIVALLTKNLSLKLDPREPPDLKPRIFLLGHAWGLLRYSHGYLDLLHRESGLPIYTMPLLNKKVYVINSPLLVNAAFSNRNLSFEPFITDFVKQMDELSHKARSAYTEGGMHAQLMQIFSIYLRSQHLRSMNTVQLNHMSTHLPSRGLLINVESLWIWLRDILTFTKTTALLGARNNPWLKDRSLVEAYWEYEKNPSRRLNLTGVGRRRPAQNHRKLVTALENYFDAAYDQSSDCRDSDIAAMTRATGALQREAGFSPTDIAAAHFIIIHGGLVSAVPTTFWAVIYVFSNEELLAQARKDALAAVTLVPADKETQRRGYKREARISSDRLEILCPLLMSVLRETQRLAAVGTLHRRVIEDTEISASEGDRKYLLRKGTAVFVPVFPVHRSETVWGSKPDEFRLGRFHKDKGPNWKRAGNESCPLEVSQPAPASLTNLQRKAYIPFGGGRELCPGRHLAVAETLGTLVMLVLGFEITRPDSSVFRLPPFSAPKMSAQTARPHPDADMRAQIKRREGWEDVTWRVSEE
ncbi:cytochrome P450 [Xylaria sp. FL1042]|nr:cytochrome P450 [Xylaria sp. FL1042]